jgi:hypothetical protein
MERTVCIIRWFRLHEMNANCKYVLSRQYCRVHEDDANCKSSTFLSNYGFAVSRSLSSILTIIKGQKLPPFSFLVVYAF